MPNTVGHHLLKNSQELHKRSTTVIPILQIRKLKLREFSNLLKITQLGSGGAGMQISLVHLQCLCLIIYVKYCKIQQITVLLCSDH